MNNQPIQNDVPRKNIFPSLGCISLIISVLVILVSMSNIFPFNCSYPECPETFWYSDSPGFIFATLFSLSGLVFGIIGLRRSMTQNRKGQILALLDIIFSAITILMFGMGFIWGIVQLTMYYK